MQKTEKRLRYNYKELKMDECWQFKFPFVFY